MYVILVCICLSVAFSRAAFDYHAVAEIRAISVSMEEGSKYDRLSTRCVVVAFLSFVAFVVLFTYMYFGLF